MNINIAKTRNRKDIESIIFDDDIKSKLISFENQDVTRGDKRLLDNNAIFYSMKKDGKCFGLAIFEKLDPLTSAADVGILKDFRGKIGLKAGRMTLDKYCKENECSQVVAKVKEENKPSLYYSLMLGFNVVLKENDIYYLRWSKDYGQRS